MSFLLNFEYWVMMHTFNCAIIRFPFKESPKTEYQRLLFSVFAERNNKSTERDDHAERCERITHKDS